MLLSVPLCLTKKLLNHIILEIAVLSHSCFHVLMKITVRQTLLLTYLNLLIFYQLVQ